MAYSRKRYEKGLRQKFRKNPGKVNKAVRKAHDEAARGARIPPAKRIPDKRRNTLVKEKEKEKNFYKA